MADCELDLDRDVVALTGDLVDVPSESRAEADLADAVERALVAIPHLSVTRDGNAVVARTTSGRGERVLIGGHLDTVPSSGNLPHRREGGFVHGLGSCDMKGGVAVALRLARTVAEPVRDVTYVFYDCEEIDSEFNGLERLARREPGWLAADFAILMEPSAAGVEAGCQGTLRAVVRTSGRRAHSARSWLGDNAVHRAMDILQRLADYEPRRVTVDGLEYREGLNAVGIAGGVAGNVIPDACEVTVNYRFAPTRTPAEAEAHVREVFAGFPVEVVDLASGALPGLDLPAARDFVAAVGAEPRPKFGWTDVARFAQLGIPAVNYGPGDPSLAHAVDERVPESDLVTCERVMVDWLSEGPANG
ncbi:MAG: succinyl-diaminopimelate desuccinylase [Candidatus Nanopelagicales bacterium]